ncbi:hypothetical protein U2F26_13735 [Micromonospora sp. 4G57]|uniref:Uncharacterized protein n=1 Tax=Micromonospora sicca TaxID=2202420 RepID=A0ABU5JAS5_9ACTN|nr:MULTISPECIES: hypothetical protein [unclassified Micromonospora]MDZ5443785.1 hypothetical protein [Micromonospora sp. 4G57]MDZ5489697.1 hypothetical protein [Micromonospora sp. 4G53]
MAENDCTACPELLMRLGAAAGGLRALAAFIESEMVEPTMHRSELLGVLAVRAANLADQAEGR